MAQHLMILSLIRPVLDHTSTSASSDSPFPTHWVAAFLAVYFLVAIAWAVGKHMRKKRKTLYYRVAKFFGDDSLKKLQYHVKTYPGYDLASVNRAITSFLNECCTTQESLGFVHFDELRDLIESERGSYIQKQKPGAVGYTRVFVNLGVEESITSNCIYICQSNLKDSEKPDKLLICIQTMSAHGNVEEDMGEQSAPMTSLKVTVACESRQRADGTFAELEERRKRLSVYRGKVIDPVVNAGGIRSIAFKRIARVEQDDLILPPTVLDLIKASIIDFYRHQDVLRSVGVEMKRGILFHSPPGTGKTSIGLYLAGLLPDFTVCFVSGRKLLYPREICSMARYLQPAMVVFEDIDLIANERDLNGLATVLGELMNQIDGCEPNDQVLFVMNTNSMNRLEQAVRDRPGRVDQIIQIPLPDEEYRAKLIRRFARNLEVGEGAVEQLAAASGGTTPATLKEVVKRAAVLAVTAGHASSNGRQQVNVTSADLMLAFAQVHARRERRKEADEVL